MRSFLIILCAVILSVSAAPALAADGMGTVIAVEGTAHAVRGGADVALASGDRLFVSDTLMTGADSKLQAMLDDESSITIGPNSSVQMVEFSNDPDDAKFVSHLAEGAMRVVTGRTTQRNPNGFKITTRHATIGIRGTDFNVTVWRGADGAYYTRVDVYSASSDDDVSVNDKNIAQFHKIVIGDDGSWEITPLAPDEMPAAELLTQLEIARGLEGITDDEVKQILNLLNDGPGFPQTELGWRDGPPDPILNNDSATGTISGNLRSDIGSDSPGVVGGTGIYSFNVNLSSGGITNGVMKGVHNCDSGNTYVQYNLYGGAGNFSPTTAGYQSFQVNGFQGSVRESTGGTFIDQPLGSGTELSGWADDFYNVGGDFSIEYGSGLSYFWGSIEDSQLTVP